MVLSNFINIIYFHSSFFSIPVYFLRHWLGRQLFAHIISANYFISSSDSLHFGCYLQLWTPNVQLGIKHREGELPWKLPVGGKQWWSGDAATLTHNSATPFFPAPDSSLSVNCSDTQHHLSLTPKPHSVLAASWEKRRCQQHFQPLLTLNPFSSLLCSSLVAPKTPILKMKRLL